MYCRRACKAQEAALRAAEAGTVGKLAGISAARDVDIDLLRMVLRLLIMRATALGLKPPDSNSGGENDKEEQENGDDAAAGEEKEVRKSRRRFLCCGWWSCVAVCGWG